VRILATPAIADTPVSFTSSNPLLLGVTASAIVPAGETTVFISLVPLGGAGQTSILIETSELRYSLSIEIDDHPADIVPIRVSQAVGVTLFLPSGGQQPVTLFPDGLQPLRLRLLPIPLEEDLVIQIVSSDPALLGVPSEVTIPAGETSITLPITVGPGSAPNSDHTVLFATAAATGEYTNGRIQTLDFTDKIVTATQNGPGGYLIGDAYSGLAVRPSTRTMYLVDGSGSNRIFQIDPNTGATLSSFVSPTGSSSLDGLAFLDDTLYALQYGGGVLVQINPDTGSGTLIGGSLGTVAGGLAGADGRLFSRGSSDQIIAERSPTTGEVLSSFSVPFATRVRGLAFDGVHLYAGSSDGSVYQLDPDSGAITDQMSLGYEVDGLAFMPSASTYRGTGTIDLQVGEIRQQIVVVVDSESAGRLPIQSPNVGIHLRAVDGSGGQLYLSPGVSQMVRLRLLTSPLLTPLSVSVVSGDELILVVGTPDPIAPGDTSTILSLVGGDAGDTTLRIVAGDLYFRLDVSVGEATPKPIVAPAVGAKVIVVGSAGGHIVIPSEANQGMRLRLFTLPVAVDTPVTITSSDTGIAEVLGTVTVPAGEVEAVMTLSGGSEGSATLKVVAGEIELNLEVEVGAADIAPLVTPAVGVEVLGE